MVRIIHAGLAMGLVGCTGQSGENPATLCDGATYREVAADDATLGFSAEDVLAALTLPVGVRWESGESTVTEDTLALSDLRIGGAVELADYSPATMPCPWEGRRLRIPITLDVAIGGDQVRVDDGTVDLLAGGTAPAEIEALGGWGLPATLSGGYDAAVDAWWTKTQEDNADWAEDFVLDGVWVSLNDRWDALEVLIEAQHRSSEYTSAEVLWRGPAVFSAPTE